MSPPRRSPPPVWLVSDGACVLCESTLLTPASSTALNTCGRRWRRRRRSKRTARVDHPPVRNENRMEYVIAQNDDCPHRVHARRDERRSIAPRASAASCQRLRESFGLKGEAEHESKA
jgi:hypothetical protein